MTEAVSAFLLVTAACALPAALFTACTRRGLPEALRRAGLAFYVAAEAIDKFRQKEVVFVEPREAR